MNTVIKTLCLTLGLCAACVYAGEQLGEHKGSRSPGSSLNMLIGVQVESVESLGTVESRNSLVSWHPGNVAGLSPAEQDAIRAQLDVRNPNTNETTRKSPLVVFGANQFTQDEQGNPIVQAKKRSLAARLCCCCCK